MGFKVFRVFHRAVEDFIGFRLTLRWSPGGFWRVPKAIQGVLQGVAGVIRDLHKLSVALQVNFGELVQRCLWCFKAFQGASGSFRRISGNLTSYQASFMGIL